VLGHKFVFGQNFGKSSELGSFENAILDY